MHWRGTDVHGRKIVEDFTRPSLAERLKALVRAPDVPPPVAPERPPFVRRRFASGRRFRSRNRRDHPANRTLDRLNQTNRLANHTVRSANRTVEGVNHTDRLANRTLDGVNRTNNALNRTDGFPNRTDNARNRPDLFLPCTPRDINPKPQTKRKKQNEK
ncbi:MAG: hypothetical protein ACREIF_03630 [Chthoniobacterales bacterium]